MNHHHLKKFVIPFLSVILPLLIYATILMLPIPKEIGLAMRFGLVPVILYVIFFLYPAFRLPGRIGTFASLSLTLVLFALPLSGAWNSGMSAGHFQGGLLQSNEGYIRRATTYRQLGNLEKAIADYTQVITANQSRIWIIKWLSHFIPKGNEQLISTYENRAALLEKTAQLDQAIADYTQVISLIHEVNDRLITAYHNRAKLYEQTNQLNKAIAD